MITENDVNELLAKYTVKEFLDLDDFKSIFVDYRCKVIVANLRIEQLMDCLIIKKSKNHEDLDNLKFFEKQKILYKLEILNDDLNHELKIINKIRNTFAHEIDPLKNKTTDLIKEFKFYDETKMPKADNPENQEKIDGAILGMITGILMRYLAEILWGTDSKNKKQ